MAPLIARDRNFFLLWLGQLLSQAGIRMYQIAILWWLLSREGGSSMGLGVFMVMAALPSILFVKPIGRLVDRRSPKQLLVGCDLAAALVVGGVAFLLHAGALTPAMTFAASFLAALVQGIFDPTLNRAIPEIVEPEDVAPAVAFQASTQSLAYFGGAVAGAMLIEVLEVEGVAALNAGTYLLSAVVNAMLRYRTPAPQVTSSTPAVDERAGMAVLEGAPELRNVLIGFGLINFFSTPTLIILPLYTKLTLGAPAQVLGLLEASLWIGLLAGSFAAAWISMGSAVRTAAVCMFTMGLCLFVPGLVVEQHLYMALLFGAGTALGINNVKFVTLFQEVVDPAIKGRFFALSQALISFTFPVAYLVFGWLGSLLDPARVCLLQGAGVMVVAIGFLMLEDPVPAAAEGV